MPKVFLMMVGFSMSGKTALVNKIVQKYPGHFTVVDSRHIHDFLNETYEVLQDGFASDGKAFELRNSLTDKIEFAMINGFLEAGHSIIQDACNLEKTDRGELLWFAKHRAPDIRTAIVYVNPDEKDLIRTLKIQDDLEEAAGKERVWQNLYEKVQKARLEKPDKEELDYFFEYNRRNIKEFWEWMDKVMK